MGGAFRADRELADDPDAAEIVDGGAEYLIATQVHERGTGRLAQLRVTLRSEM